MSFFTKKQFSKTALAALAGASVVALAACGGSTTPAQSGGAAGGAEDAITVYNAQHDSLTQAWVDEFTTETGIKVTIRPGSDLELSNQIIAEGDKSPADVFPTENSPAMTQVENAGLFADISQTVQDQVPAEYRPSTNKWTGIAARSTVFAYDKTKLKADQLPKSIMDLADPAWKDRWAASPSGADFQAIVSAMLEVEGEDATASWLKSMKENSTAVKGNSTAMKAVNAGQVEGAVIYHYYWFGDQAKTGENSENVAMHYFKNEDPGAFVSISGGGVLASSQHQDSAASDVAANDKLVPLAELQAPKIDPAKLNSAKVTELMTQAGLL